MCHRGPNRPDCPVDSPATIRRPRAADNLQGPNRRSFDPIAARDPARRRHSALLQTPQANQSQGQVAFIHSERVVIEYPNLPAGVELGAMDRMAAFFLVAGFCRTPSPDL